MLKEGQPVDEVLQVLSESEKPFHGLESQYTQEKYFKEHLGLVVRLDCT